MDVLLVAFGGAFGCVLRYLIGKAADGVAAGMPLGTLAVNALAALAVGALLALSQQAPLDERLRLLLVVGLLGGFSTFSAFSAETLAMLQAQQWLAALANVGLNVGLSLALAALGWWAASSIIAASR
jgi:CrcB protein